MIVDINKQKKSLMKPNKNNNLNSFDPLRERTLTAICSNQIILQRTGRAYGIGSSEYHVVFPNGDKTFVWTPVWNDWDEETEDEKTKEHVITLWKDKEYVTHSYKSYVTMLDYTNNMEHAGNILTINLAP